MSIFNHDSYKLFAREWVASLPNGGRGAYRRMAQHLDISSTMISQIFNGDKELSLELAADLSTFFAFNESEERYFFLLVEHGRAGSSRLKEKLEKQMRVLKAEAQKIIEHVARHKELTAEDKAIYYSSWIFTGLRNLLAIPRNWTTSELAATLQISEMQVRSTLQFLTDRQLIGLEKGRYQVLARATHIGADNPLVNKHHQNWRIRAIQKMDLRDPSHLFYTGPMSLSSDDADKVRAMFLDLIQNVNKVVVDSPSETVRCMNIDWFEF